MSLYFNVQAQEEADYDTSGYAYEAYAATARDMQLFNDTEEVDYQYRVSLYKTTYARCGGSLNPMDCGDTNCMDCLPF